MGKSIIMLDGKFMHWSSITDAPGTPLLPEHLFEKYWKDEYGRSGMVDYATDMEITKSSGVSSSRYGVSKTADDIIKHNCAGKDGNCLTKTQIIEYYTMTDEAEFEKWSTRRNAAFAKMAIDFGPEGQKAREMKKST